MIEEQRNFAAEEKRLKRQQALATMLSQSATTANPSQMAGGYVVPISPMQGLADVGSKLAAALMMRSADKKETSLISDKAQAYARVLGQMPKDPAELPAFISRLNTFDPKLASTLLEEQFKGQMKPEEFGTTPQFANGPDGKPQAFVLGNRGGRRQLDGVLPRDKMEVLETTGTVINPYDVKPGTQLPTDPNKPFTIGQDGSMVPNTAFQSYEVGKAAAGATRVNTNVIPNTVGQGVAEATIKDLSARREGTGGLMQTIGAANEIMRLIDSGKVITGPGTNMLVTLSNYLPIGGKDTQEKLKNTRVLFSQMAKQTLAVAEKLKPVSNTDMVYLAKAAGGDLNLPDQAIRRIAELNALGAQKQLEQFNADVDSTTGYLQQQGQGGLPFDYRVQIPQVYKPPVASAGAGGAPKPTLDDVAAEIARRRRGGK